MDKVIQEIKTDLLDYESYRYVTLFVENEGKRLAGTKSIEKAANYITNKLESYGIDTRIEKFYIYQLSEICCLEGFIP